MLDYERLSIDFGFARQSLMRVNHESDQDAVTGAFDRIRRNLTDDLIAQHDEETRQLMRALADLDKRDPAEFDDQSYHLLAICIDAVADHVTMRYWLGQVQTG